MNKYSYKEGFTLTYIYILEGLHCANCASKIQDKLNKQDYIKEAELNFMLKKLTIHLKEEKNYTENELIPLLQKIVDSIEFGVKVISRNTMSEQDSMIIEDESACTCHAHGDEHEHCHTDHHEHQHCNTHNRRHVKGVHRAHTDINDTGKQFYINKEFISMLSGFILFGVGFIVNQDIIFMISYLLLGYDVIYKAFKNITRGQVLDENFLMTIATIAAFAIGEYPEAVAVMAFYKIGEYFQERAVNHSQKQIEEAMDIRPDFARIIIQGKTKSISPKDVKVGNILEIRVGEKIPLDGEVIEGSSMLDTAMLTGESLPTRVEKGDKVLSGSINKESVIKVKVTTRFEESTVTKILELIKNASSKKAKSEKFITKFARVYTPVVVAIAVATAIIPSIITGNWEHYIYLSILFLVISCPCALVVSIPLGFFAGIGSAARMGVLIKGGNYLESLNEINTVVLDKTGTITKGEFGVASIIQTNDISKQELLEIAARLEVKSNHQIAQSIVREYGSTEPVQGKYSEYSGEGVVVEEENTIWLAGNDKLMQRYNIEYQETKEIGSIVHIAKNSIYLGTIVVTDKIKDSSKQAISDLKSSGIKRVIMLTGDKKDNADKVGAEVGIEEIYAELLPQDKVSKLEQILKESKAVFVGDGINDAPVLARADIGVAMGGAGSDAAIEAADIVLMTDDLMSLSRARHIAKETRRVVTENIIFALGTKVLVMVLGMLGMANMWLAIFADVGVSLIAILNSIRILRKK